jgi:F-box-like
LFFPIFPAQILTKIIDLLKLKGQLRCSLVSKRWFDVVQNNGKLMRRLVFTLEHEKDYQRFMTVSLRRVYRNVKFVLLITYEELDIHMLASSLESLVASAECIQLLRCDLSIEEFGLLLSWCQTARKFEMKELALRHKEWNDLDVNELIVQPSKLGPVECVLERSSCYALMFFEKIEKLSVVLFDLMFKIDQRTIALLEQWAPVIEKLLVISESKSNVFEIFSIENLQASSLGIVSNHWKMDAIGLHQMNQFFELHGGHMTNFCYFSASRQQEVFDLICECMVNLESLEVTVDGDLDLNGLQQLRKLRKVKLLPATYSVSELNIPNASFTELILELWNRNIKYKPCHLPSVKRLEINICVAQLNTIDQFVEMVPNLEHFCLIINAAVIVEEVYEVSLSK